MFFYCKPVFSQNILGAKFWTSQSKSIPFKNICLLKFFYIYMSRNKLETIFKREMRVWKNSMEELNFISQSHWTPETTEKSFSSCMASDSDASISFYWVAQAEETDVDSIDVFLSKSYKLGLFLWGLFGTWFKSLNWEIHLTSFRWTSLPLQNVLFIVSMAGRQASYLTARHPLST